MADVESTQGNFHKYINCCTTAEYAANPLTHYAGLNSISIYNNYMIPIPDTYTFSWKSCMFVGDLGDYS